MKRKSYRARKRWIVTNGTKYKAWHKSKAKALAEFKWLQNRGYDATITKES